MREADDVTLWAWPIDRDDVTAVWLRVSVDAVWW